MNSRSSTRIVDDALALVVRCSRVALRESDWAALDELLDRDFEWGAVLSLAARHGVGALLLRHLDGLECGRVPEYVLAGLRAASQRNARRNLYLCSQLGVVVDALARRGIPVLPFKGPSLGVLLYGGLGVRPAGDLDLLIHPRHLASAISALELLDIRRRVRPPRSRAGWRVLLDLGHEVHLDRARDGLNIDLHWRLIPRRYRVSLDLETLARPLASVELGTRRFETFAGEDLILYLALHGGNSRWTRGIWLADLHEAVEQGSGLDWDRILGRARAWGCRRLVMVALQLLRDRWGTNFPPLVESAMEGDGGSIRRLADRVWFEHFDNHSPRATTWTASWRGRLSNAVDVWRLAQLDGWRERVRYSAARSCYFVMAPNRRVPDAPRSSEA